MSQKTLANNRRMQTPNTHLIVALRASWRRVCVAVVVGKFNTRHELVQKLVQLLAVDVAVACVVIIVFVRRALFLAS